MQPASSLGVTILAVVSLILWMLWPVFIKRSTRLRWEFFYYDFLFGAIIATLLGGFTAGTFGTEITFRDNIAIVGYRQLAFAAMAGGVFSLGAIAFVASVTVAGASVGGVLTGASALITGTIIAYFFSGSVSTGVQFAGVALSLVAFLLIARFHSEALRLQKKDLTHKTPMRKKVNTVSAGVVVTLCIVAGLGLGSFLPFIDWARGFDLPMTAFPMAAMFALGMFAVGFALNLYFVNLPVQGDPVSPFGYFKAGPALHINGLLAGILFGVGLIAYLLLFDAPASLAVHRGVLVAIVPASLGLFSILGRTVWNEYDEAVYRTKTAFFAGGFVIALSALAVVAGYI